IEPRVTGVDETVRTLGDGICNALGGVRNLRAIESRAAKVERGTRRQLGNPDRKSRRGDPLAVRSRESFEQGLGAGRADDVDRSAARGKLAVLPGENEAGEVSR